MPKTRTAWDDEPTIRSSWDDEPKAEAPKDLNAAERAMLSYGTGAWEGIRKAANWSFGMPSAPEFIQDQAVKRGQANLDKITAGHTWSGKVPAFVGELVGPTVATAPMGFTGAAAKGVAALPWYARLLTRGAAGAAQGAVQGGMMGDDPVTGAEVGGPVAMVAPAIAQTLINGGRRASKAAVNLFEPGLEKMREIAEKYRPDGGIIDDGLVKAGEALRSARVGSRRLVTPGKTMGERGLMLDALGEEAGLEIDDVLSRADEMGLRADPAAVVAKLEGIRNKYFGGAVRDLTQTQRAGRRAADDLITRYKSAYGEHFKDAGPLVGTVKGGERPLALPRRNAAGEVVGEDQVLSLDRVGATSPQPTRVFSPPEKLGKIVKQDPTTKRFMKGEPAPQPHLQESSMVNVPEETTIATEGAQSGSPTHAFARMEVSDAPTLPDALRKRLEKNGIDTTRRLTEDEINNVNIRKIIHADTEMGPRQKRLLLTTGTTRDPELDAIRKVKWRQSMMVDPDFTGEIGRNIEINRQPLSAHEAAKRVVGKEGYLRGAKYFDANAAKEDPGVQFFRQAYGVMKGDVEEALTPGLRSRFMPAKEQSQLAQVFGPQAETAQLAGELVNDSARSTIHGNVFSRGWRAAERGARPYWVVANEVTEKIGKNLPKGTQDALRAAVIEILRSKEKR